MTAVTPTKQPPLAPTIQPLTSSAEKCFLMKVTEFALKVLLPFAAVFALYAIFPITFVAVHIPFIGVAAAISYAFLFRSPEEVLAPLPIDAPRGIINRGANCWVNALTQTLRADVGIKNWIEQSPEGLETRLSHAALIDPKILFTPEELSLYPVEAVPLIPVFQIPTLPANFAQMSPEARLNYRKACNAKILDWVFKNFEISHIAAPAIFSESAVDDIIDGIEVFPVEEQAGRLRNARSLVTKIRDFSEALEMNEEEKLQLSDSIEEFSSACYLLRESTVLDWADLLLGAERPAVEPTIEFDGCQQVNPILTLHHLAGKYPFIKRMILTAKAVKTLNVAERQNLLKYLSVIHSIESSKRLASMQFLASYKKFFSDYERDRMDGLTHTFSSSQQLRLAFSQNSINPAGRFQISQRIGEQCDPAEAIRFIEPLLPLALKGSAISNGAIVTHQGLISLPTIDAVGVNPSVQAMINGNVDEMNVNMDQFYTAPSSLWPSIHRFKFDRPTSFFHSILPCCFPKPAPQSMKITSPIQLDDQITINTVQEGVVAYKLDSFIVHIGDSADSGHYISYKLEQDASGNPIWYELNDAQVRVVSGEILAQAKAQAYLPHYSRI